MNINEELLTYCFKGRCQTAVWFLNEILNSKDFQPQYVSKLNTGLTYRNDKYLANLKKEIEANYIYAFAYNLTIPKYHKIYYDDNERYARLLIKGLLDSGCNYYWPSVDNNEVLNCFIKAQKPSVLDYYLSLGVPLPEKVNNVSLFEYSLEYGYGNILVLLKYGMKFENYKDIPLAFQIVKAPNYMRATHKLILLKTIEEKGIDVGYGETYKDKNIFEFVFQNSGLTGDKREKIVDFLLQKPELVNLIENATYQNSYGRIPLLKHCENVQPQLALKMEKAILKNSVINIPLSSQKKQKNKI